MYKLLKFIEKWKLFAGLTLVILLSISLGLWNLGNAGQVWDERALLELGYKQIKLAEKLDFGNEFFWKGEAIDHPPLVRYVRGFVSQLDIEAFQNSTPIFKYDLNYSRLLSVLLYVLTAVTIFLFGYKFISFFNGLVAAVILSMLPIVVGHSQLVMYEPFNLFFYTASVVSFVFFINKPNLNKLIITSIFLGFALLSKETNFLLIPMYLLTIVIKHFYKNEQNTKSLLVKTLFIFTLSFFVFFIFWPAPFFHLSDFISTQFALRATPTHPIPEVFFGRLMFVPIFYYFIYVIVTTPLIILILFLLGLLKIDKSKNWILYTCVLWFLLPFILSFYPKREQGIRYIIQISAPLALIAAIGFSSLIEFFTKGHKAKIIALIFLIIYMFSNLYKITPYYIDYFNVLVGGPKGVHEKELFHLGWWGEGISESFKYLDKNAPSGSYVGIATVPSHILPTLKNRHIEIYSASKKYDFVVVNFYNVVRLGFDDTRIKNDYYAVYKVMADGAPIVIVYKKK